VIFRGSLGRRVPRALRALAWRAAAIDPIEAVKAE
jgi:hypothetical protein